MAEALLEIQGVKKYFPVTKGLLFARIAGWIKAVDGVSFSICQGDTFGLVGESGCGKTTTSRLILLLERLSGGSILFQGKDITKLAGADLKKYRSLTQAVFQDPYSSLSPRMRVGEIIAEPIVVNESLPRKAVEERVREVLVQVGLGPENAGLYPHEFSGGQRQRIAVARALAVHPSLVILDEPVSALDISIRAQIINMLKELQSQLGLTYLLIAHDLAVVRQLSNQVGVMYLGKIVELSQTEDLYTRPLHPYTVALLSAALPLHPDAPRKRVVLSGEVPSPLDPPAGCRFHPRCPSFMPICRQTEPQLKSAAPAHLVACHLV